MRHGLRCFFAADIGEKKGGVGAVVHIEGFYHGSGNAGIVQRIQPTCGSFFFAVADDGAAAFTSMLTPPGCSNSS